MVQARERVPMGGPAAGPVSPLRVARKASTLARSKPSTCRERPRDASQKGCRPGRKRQPGTRRSSGRTLRAPLPAPSTYPRKPECLTLGVDESQPPGVADCQQSESNDGRS